MAVEQKSPITKSKSVDAPKIVQRAQGPTVEQKSILPRPSSVLQRAKDDPGSLSPVEMDVLQRTIGLRAAKQMVRPAKSPISRAPLTFQTKLSVGPVGDKYEQEADAVAKQVMRQMEGGTAKASTSQRKPESEEPIQRSATVPSVAPSISPLQRDDAASSPGDPMLGGGTLSGNLESAVHRAKSGGRPLDDGVRGSMEKAFKADFSGVKVHTDSQADTLNRSISARAFTTGQDVFFKHGQYNPGSSSGKQLLAHELTHVVQQQPVVSRKYAQNHAGEPSALGGLPVGAMVQRAPVGIQRTYAALGTMAKARVDQKADEKYAEKTQEFEFKMATKIMKNPAANAVVDSLLARTKQIVDAWAESTGRAKEEAYAREFGWRGGDDYYGAFQMTGENIKKVFEDKTQPMRTKLKVVYNAVRNSNLSKWLQLAAIELDRAAKKKTPRNWKIKSSTTGVKEFDKKAKKWKLSAKPNAQKETVNTGFAKKSGLEDWLKPEQVKEFSETHEREKQTTTKRSKRHVFGHDMLSGVMGWKAETSKANSERTGKDKRLKWSERDTLKMGDVSDMTDAEIDQLHLNEGKPLPTPEERTKFKLDPKAKVNWGMGGEYFDINLGSDSSKEAAKFKARLEAGISGSTDLMMHAMQNLGLDDEASMKGMRLALAGWMMANRDHSFYEIYKAAESYGVPLEIDKDNPGAEYESASNLSPMVKDDFTDTLPEAKFPSYYQSTAYKDELSDQLAEPAKDKTAVEAALKAQGVSDTLLAKLDEKGLAELSRMSEIVEKANINPGARQALREQALRRIRRHISYIYLGNTLGPADAEAMMLALLKTHHRGKGLAPVEDNNLETLADAGIPRMVLDPLKAKDIDKLEAVRRAVMALKVSPKTRQFDMKPVNTALGKVSGLNATYRQLVKSVLIQTYHGNVALNENEQFQANALRMMVSKKESSAKKLSHEQLEALPTAKPSDGDAISEDDYWKSSVADDNLKKTVSTSVGPMLAKIKDPQKSQIRTAIFIQALKNKHEDVEAFKDVEKDEGFPVAVTSFTPPDLIEKLVLPPEMQAAVTGLKELHPKERGAILQYTTALYKPIVNALNSFSTDDFGTGNLTDVKWGGKLGTLKYVGNMMQALSSGLAKLPLYTSPVFRLVTTSENYLTATDQKRQQVAASYKPGKIETQNYPMSTMKSLGAQFASTNYGNGTFSVVYEIINIKTGHDIQWVSDQFKEEEVLFEPGSRLRVRESFPHNPNDPSDKHVWVRLEEV